jgi:hypothetical protein
MTAVEDKLCQLIPELLVVKKRIFPTHPSQKSISGWKNRFYFHEGVDREMLFSAELPLNTDRQDFRFLFTRCPVLLPRTRGKLLATLI